MRAPRSPLPLRLIASAASALAIAAAPRPALADVSSWFSLRGGLALHQWTGQKQMGRLVTPFDVGVGSPPSGALMLGVGVQMAPTWVEGVDFASYVRLATQGYVVGKLGLALDGGGFLRTNGPVVGGGYGALNLGGPWGLVLTGAYQRGDLSAQSVTITAGIDFLRLSVYRLSGENQWPNVNPAYRLNGATRPAAPAADRPAARSPGRPARRAPTPSAHRP